MSTCVLVHAWSARGPASRDNRCTLSATPVKVEVKTSCPRVNIPTAAV